MTKSFPSGFYKYTWDWVDRYIQINSLYRWPNDWYESVSSVYKRVYSKETSIMKMPLFLQEDYIPLFELHFELNTRDGAMIVIPGGKYANDGNQMAVLTPDNELICEASYGDENDPFSHWLFKSHTLGSKETLRGNVALLVCRPDWHTNYYHWMFDVLAKIDLLNHSGIEIDHYIIPSRCRQFHYETLKLLGIPESKLIENNANHFIEVEHLVLPLQPVLTPEWACQYLRKALACKKSMNAENQTNEKIYISRSDATYRRITNENEVVSFLIGEGFSVVSMNGLSFEEQVAIFQNAKLIVSPHGAGLTNLLFSGKDTKVVELFSPSYVHPVYWILSNRMGLDYAYILGEGPRQPDAAYSKWPETSGEEDLTINTSKLKRVLSSFC